MSWLRLDDGFSTHPKLVMLGSGGKRWQFVELMLYCAKHRTDGYFPAGVAPAAFVRRCVEVGLVDVEENGEHRVHDWAKYNPSSDPTGATRQQRWRNAKRNAPVTENVTDDSGPSRGRARVPVPVPSLRTEDEVETTSSSRSLAVVVALPLTAQQLVGGFVDQTVALGGEPPPRRVTGQIARLCGEMLKEGVSAANVQAGLALLLERRLHPSTLPSLVHEASLPRRQASKPGRVTPSEIMAQAQQLHDAEKELFHDAG